MHNLLIYSTDCPGVVVYYRIILNINKNKNIQIINKNHDKICK